MAKTIYCCVLLFISHTVYCAPKSKTGTTYDQKQTGEYNIQLHLKDFQIIAVVGEESLGSLSGDYDYDYDYSDFTIKPIVPITTKKPDLDHQNTTSPSVSTTTQKNNFTHPYSLIYPSTTKQPTITANSVEFTTQITTTKINKITAVTESENITTSQKSFEDFTSHISNTGQIPVIVQDFTKQDNPSVVLLKDGNSDKKNEAVTNIAIVPSEDMGAEQQEQITLGEILHYRRCAQGYARDKRGRCRKVRRPPQIPLGITRFASNLAAKFRQATTPEFEPLEQVKDS